MNILKKASVCFFLSLICFMSLPSIAIATGGIRPKEFAILVSDGGGGGMLVAAESPEELNTETNEKKGQTGTFKIPDPLIEYGCRVILAKGVLYDDDNPNSIPTTIKVIMTPLSPSVPVITLNVHPDAFNNAPNGIDITHFYMYMAEYIGIDIEYKLIVTRGHDSLIKSKVARHNTPASDCPESGALKLNAYDDSSFMDNINIFPTPCRTHQNIEYSLGKDAHVNISIFDMQGRLHTVVSDAYQEEGFYSLDVDTSPLPPGIYFYKIRIDDMWSEHKFVKM